MAAPELLERMAIAVSGALPAGHGVIVFLLEPRPDEKLQLNVIDTLDGDPNRIARVVVQWMLGQSPQIILDAFAFERRAKLAAELGVDMTDV